MVNKLIGDNLNWLRTREKKSMGQLAKILGVTKQKVARIEYGKSIDPEALILISKFFEVSLDDLMQRDISQINTVTKVETKPVPDIEKPSIVVSDNIPVPDTQPPNENIGKALECAKKMNFTCHFFNEKKEQFEFCKDCFTAEFWNKAQIAQEINSSKVEDVVPAGTDYMSCDMFQMNPNPNCYLRNVQKANMPKCAECLRDINRWKENAIGYKESVK